MTEDDTFNALCRTPLKKLQDLMQEAENDDLFVGAIYHPFSEVEIAYLWRHGWTLNEFKKAWAAQAIEEDVNITTYLWWPNFIKSIE